MNLPLLQNECSANTFCRSNSFSYRMALREDLIWNRGTRFIIWNSPLAGRGKYCGDCFVLPKNTGLIWRNTNTKKTPKNHPTISPGHFHYGWNLKTVAYYLAPQICFEQKWYTKSQARTALRLGAGSTPLYDHWIPAAGVLSMFEEQLILSEQISCKRS